MLELIHIKFIYYNMLWYFAPHIQVMWETWQYACLLLKLMVDIQDQTQNGVGGGGGGGGGTN